MSILDEITFSRDDEKGSDSSGSNVKTFPAGTQLEFHEYAEELPPMQKERRAAVFNDIAANGQRETLKIWNGLIADGRHRYKILVELDKEIKYEDVSHLSEIELYSYVYSLNNRRSETIGQKAMTAVRSSLARDLYEQGESIKLDSLNSGSREKRGKTSDILSTFFGVSRDSVERARKINTTDPELAQQVYSGTKSLNEAHTEVVKSKKESPRPKVKKSLFEKKISDINRLNCDLAELSEEEYSLFKERVNEFCEGL